MRGLGESFLVLGIVIAAVNCDSLRSFPSDRAVTERFVTLVTDSTTITIDFRTIAPASWSRLYVFGSYTSEAAAERIMGLDWAYRWPPIEHQDGDALFVFVDSGRVALALHHPHGESRLSGIADLFRADGYPRDSAQFQLVPDPARGEPYRRVVRGGGLTPFAADKRGQLR